MGKYNVNQQLYALGKYMTAYDAVQEGLGKKVEIRILAQRAQEGSMELSRFSTEINNLKNLDHPAILRVLDCGAANGKLYYVVELKKRLTVQEYMQQQPPPTLEEKLKICVQLASALKYMHGRGIIHRGIDDGAVNYDPEVGQAYVSQFTFVKNMRTDNLTSRGIGNVFQLLTTPEGAMGQTLDARSDVFLLGVLAFKMLTGQEPYSAKAFLGLTTETAANVQQKKLKELDPACLDALDAALARASAVLPTNRFQTAQEFHDALLDVGKKLKLPKWADRDKTSQPVSPTTIVEGAEPEKAKATASTTDNPVSKPVRAGRKPGGPPSSSISKGDADAPSAGALAPAATTPADKLKALLADPQKKKLVIGGAVAAVMFLVGVLLVALR